MKYQRNLQQIKQQASLRRAITPIHFVTRSKTFQYTFARRIFPGVAAVTFNFPTKAALVFRLSLNRVDRDEGKPEASLAENRSSNPENRAWKN